MKAAILPDRGVVKVVGNEARTFLNGLLTADIADVSPGRGRYAALLTPQGKIIADCIVMEHEGALLLDCPRELAGPLSQRLTFYKLRARITIEDVSEQLAVIALWNGAGGKPPEGAVADPRLAALGWRVIVPSGTASGFAADHGLDAANAVDYDAHRIALGVPRGGPDFAYSDAFPHEADMDQLNGVDFDKGCYVGQEVVSRMEHRGTARNRVVPIALDGAAPETGTPVTAGGRQIGTAGSSAGGRGLALLRLDRVADAAAAGEPLRAGDVTITLRKPDWARFAFPGDKAAE
jgi:tRNA-modifying protein YgfZ